VSIHVGPRFLYGLLGAEFSPDQSARLLIQVPLSTEQGEQIASPVATPTEITRAGLPDQYARGVLEAAECGEAYRLLGSGLLRYESAAHGMVGSSIDLFRRLAIIVAQLLTLDTQEVAETQLATLLERELRRQAK
jgi:hypothetical protein